MTTKPPTHDELQEAENAAYIYAKYVASEGVYAALKRFIQDPKQANYVGLDIQFERFKTAYEKFEAATKANEEGAK